MSIKRKLMLMGICVGIIAIVLTVNVVRRVREDSPGGDNTAINENIMTRAEAYRLLSYLQYNKSEREALNNNIQYSDEQMSGWYDTYVNALCSMGLIDSKVKESPKEALTYGYCKELTDKLIMKNPDYQAVYQNLSFEFTKADQDMQVKDFLELYQAMLQVIPEKDRRVKEASLLVLGREVTEDGIDRMVTDQGKYYYQAAKSYIEYMNTKQADSVSSQDITVTPAASSADKNTLIEQYLDQGIKVLLCDQEILYITSVTNEAVVIPNVWIKEAKDKTVDTFVNDIDKSFSTVSEISTPLEKVVGDITIENRKIVKINVKPDMIKGKVLSTGKNYIEVKGYGKLPLDDNFTIYKIYGTLSVEPTDSILVGYENTDFVVSDGKISAALITQSIKAEDIRVLLNTTGYQGINHKSVVFTATSGFTVSTKNKTSTYKKGEKVTIKPGDSILQDGRVTVKTDSDKAKIKVLSIERACGNPKYRGTLEITKGDNGLILVNELPLEEYLYAVIPSEMPTSYEAEALKVQAVCARSYAYKHLLANTLSAYGAHVDDSAAYQVYNNAAENDASILAVKDTYGEVIKYKDEIITAYYYSTSCGHTSEPSSVWADSVSLPYLKGKLLLAGQEDDTVTAESTNSDSYQDLSTESVFKRFITSTALKTCDSSFSWYRWKVTMSVKDIRKVIDSTLKVRYNANPNLILTRTKKGKKTVYKSMPIDTVGQIRDIKVLKRESSGIISQLLIKGSKNTIKVLKDYNIRALLAPKYDSVIRQDNSKAEKLSLLPSSYFMIEKKTKNGKVKSVTLIGGGFGHGVGMSQNAVQSLAQAGKDYKNIISYFYDGTQLGTIYE